MTTTVHVSALDESTNLDQSGSHAAQDSAWTVNNALDKHFLGVWDIEKTWRLPSIYFVVLSLLYGDQYDLAEQNLADYCLNLQGRLDGQHRVNGDSVLLAIGRPHCKAQLRRLFRVPYPSSPTHKNKACTRHAFIAYHHHWTNSGTIITSEAHQLSITITCPLCPRDALLAPFLVRHPGNTLVKLAKVAKRAALAHIAFA